MPLLARTAMGPLKREIADKLVPALVEILQGMEGIIEAHLLMVFQPGEMETPLPLLVVRFRSRRSMRAGMDRFASTIQQDILIEPLNWWNPGIFSYRIKGSLIYKGPRPWWQIWDDGQEYSRSVKRSSAK